MVDKVFPPTHYKLLLINEFNQDLADKNKLLETNWDIIISFPD